MPIAELSSSQVIPDDALCFECGYSLRGLQVPRCPECGWEFDPSDTELMEVCRGRSKFARGIMGPIPAWVRTVVLLGCWGIIWGSALLPGSLTVEMYGWIVLGFVTLYSMTRRSIRASLRMRVFVPRQIQPPSEHYSRWQLLIVALATTSPFTALPLRINVLIEGPLLNHLAHQVYAVEPMVFPKPPPRFAGLFVFSGAHTAYDGVWFEVPGGGELYWQAPDVPSPHYFPQSAEWIGVGGQFHAPEPICEILNFAKRFF